jgi:hypothetical protein
LSPATTTHHRNAGSGLDVMTQNPKTAFRDTPPRT